MQTRIDLSCLGFSERERPNQLSGQCRERGISRGDSAQWFSGGGVELWEATGVEARQIVIYSSEKKYSTCEVDLKSDLGAWEDDRGVASRRAFQQWRIDGNATVLTLTKEAHGCASVLNPPTPSRSPRYPITISTRFGQHRYEIYRHCCRLLQAQISSRRRKNYHQSYLHQGSCCFSRVVWRKCCWLLGGGDSGGYGVVGCCVCVP